jgi:hypothetical protein
MAHINSTIIKDDELILRASAAATSTQTGTGIKMGPCQLVKAVVHVSALTSTPTISVAIQQGTGDTGYSTVITFPDITAVGLYEVYFKTTEAWVRYLATHSDSDSITYEIIVTTAEK